MANLITRSARRSTRHVCGGSTYLTSLKAEAHRRARRVSNETTRRVAFGHLDADAADFEPNFTIDGRDVS